MGGFQNKNCSQLLSKFLYVRHIIIALHKCTSLNSFEVGQCSFRNITLHRYRKQGWKGLSDLQGHTSTRWGQGLNQDSLFSQVLITTLMADGAGLQDHAHGSGKPFKCEQVNAPTWTGCWGPWPTYLLYIYMHNFIYTEGRAGKLTAVWWLFTASRSLRTPSSSRLLHLHSLSGCRTWYEAGTP